jgi:hypothetical protein
VDPEYICQNRSAAGTPICSGQDSATNPTHTHSRLNHYPALKVRGTTSSCNNYLSHMYGKISTPEVTRTHTCKFTTDESSIPSARVSFARSLNFSNISQTAGIRSCSWHDKAVSSRRRLGNDFRFCLRFRFGHRCNTVINEMLGPNKYMATKQVFDTQRDKQR